MSAPKQRPVVPHVEVADPAEAMRKLGSFARQVLSVPKAEIDRKLAAEKTAKHKAKRR
jgi:hypothetical protein